MELVHNNLGPAARLVNWQADEDGLTVTLAATAPFTGTLIFKHGTPLCLESTQGVQAELEHRNDRYGYQMWELRLHAPAEGQGTIYMAVVPPPSTPLPYTEEDYAAFCRDFDERPSRFPNEPEAFRAWQAEYRQRLWGWLMGGSRPDLIPPETQWEPLATAEDFTLERMIYRSRPDRSPVALLALPKDAARPAPLILALHGHETTWGVAEPEAFQPGHDDDFCHYFASHGYAVLQTPTMDHTLQDERWALVGEWAWDAIAGLSAALARPEIDANRIGVVGLSTGAQITQIVAALDNRLRAAVVAGIFGTRNHTRRHFRIPPHCDCGSGKTLYAHLEHADLAALAAPKAVQIQHGRQDHVMCPGADPAKLDLHWNTGVMPPQEFEHAIEEVRRAYRLAGVPNRCAIHFHPQGHAVDNQAALTWISAALEENRP